MSGTDSTATDQAVPADLISFLKAIPDGRYRRGVLNNVVGLHT
jgi:hypothetical protein